MIDAGKHSQHVLLAFGYFFLAHNKLFRRLAPFICLSAHSLHQPACPG
jgi:hypothetical protein